MVDSPKNLSRAARFSLVVGLWVVLVALIALAVRNIGWVLSWANGIFSGCIFFVGLLLAFSFVAAAVHLSIDTIKGLYPYPPTDERPPAALIATGLTALSEDGSSLRSSDALPAAGSWRKIALNVLGVAAVTLVMTLVLLEVGLRFFAPQASPEMRAALWNSLFIPDSAAIYRNRPGVDTAFRLDESTTRWSVNSQGLRENHEVTSPAAGTDGTVRILNIGDSFAFGYGVEENETFSYLLNGTGALGGKRTESINAGVSGYGTDNEAAWLHTTAGLTIRTLCS